MSTTKKTPSLQLALASLGPRACLLGIVQHLEDLGSHLEDGTGDPEPSLRAALRVFMKTARDLAPGVPDVAADAADPTEEDFKALWKSFRSFGGQTNVRRIAKSLDESLPVRVLLLDACRDFSEACAREGIV